MSTHFDLVVVGAGPAGSAAALVGARAGLSVALVERGPSPGSKNMYGGVIYGRILDDLIPNWWEEAPIQRWIVRRGTMIATETQSVTIDVRSTKWGTAPYNGCTALRPDFDAWLAQKAVDAGATLITSTTVTGLLTEDDLGRHSLEPNQRTGSSAAPGHPPSEATRPTGAGPHRSAPSDSGPARNIRGVRTDRVDGDLTAGVVIACDGVNSFLAREAGLHQHNGAEHYTLGVKEVLKLDPEVIEQRFAVRGNEGVDYEIVGCTQGIPGGGFLYTNADSVAVGLVLHLPALGASGRRPEDLIADMKQHPAIAPLVEGGEMVEYSAHLIPEAGYDAMPDFCTDQLLVAGDAAGMCLAAGIWLEGVNYAIGSGAIAARTAIDALAANDTTAARLGEYRTRLEESWVLKDHERLRRVPGLLMGERVQQRYPELVCNLVEEIFTVGNPEPKPRFGAVARAELQRSGVKLRELTSDAVTALRSFG